MIVSFLSPTNIAEASITIDSLKFVVDTGIEKTMTFDFERRSNILKTNTITEASRLQRKGRVGRVSSGTIYYNYKPHSLENNKKQFGISIQDIHQSIFLDLIKEPNDIPIFSDFINQIVSGNTNVNLHHTINISKNDLGIIIQKNGINPMTEKLFIKNCFLILNDNKNLPIDRRLSMVDKQRLLNIITQEYKRIHKNTINDKIKQIITDIIKLVDDPKYQIINTTLNKEQIKQIVSQDYQKLFKKSNGKTESDPTTFVESISCFFV